MASNVKVDCIQYSRGLALQYAHILYGSGIEIEYFYQSYDVVQLDDGIKHVFLCAFVAEDVSGDMVIMPFFVNSPESFYAGDHNDLRVLVLEATQCKLSKVS